MRTAAVVVAAGQGRRMGADRPKCLLDLCGRPVFLWALDPFLGLDGVCAVALVAPPGWEQRVAEAVERHDPRGLVRTVSGGAQRPESVLAGLEAVLPCDPEVVAIHDGARPLADEDLVARCLAAAGEHRAAIAAAPSTDTLKEARDGRIMRTLDRGTVWRAQTPQAFETQLICEAYRRARAEGSRATDDAALVERLGVQAVLVESDWTNLKITTREHLLVAEALLQGRSSGT